MICCAMHKSKGIQFAVGLLSHAQVQRNTVCCRPAVLVMQKSKGIQFAVGLLCHAEVQSEYSVL